MAPFDRRLRAARDGLREAGADALALFPSRNLFYLTGFDEEPGERHLFLFVPADGGPESVDSGARRTSSDGDPVFLVPDLYAEQIRERTPIEDVRTWADGDDPTAALSDVVSDLGLGDGRLLVDDAMWARFTQDLRAVCPEATFGLASEVLAPLRLRKDEAELDALRRAGALADRAAEEIRALGEDAVGRTEDDIAREIERRLADGGGEGVSFEPIVGSGPNGAMPHHAHGDRVIEAGDPVVLDFGAFVDGYAGDQTRTVVFAGDPSEEFPEVHRVVREAQEAGVAAVEPGVAAAEIDRAAREVIEAAGYGDEFVHRTGHGVGLEIHEEPYVVEGNDRELEPGMVFSVEPGVYLPGEFGVRIEDLVAVTDDGCERLNDSDRGWHSGG